MTQTKRYAYELTFFGSATAPYFPARYKRFHSTADSVRATIESVFSKMEGRGLPTACHSPVVYDASGKQVSLVA